MVIFNRILAVLQNRKLSEFCSQPFRGKENNSEFRSVEQKERQIDANSHNSLPKHSAEEKITQNSVLWNKNRSKLSEFPFEPFRGRENNSDFRSVEYSK
jgi:hypothetical protein